MSSLQYYKNPMYEEGYKKVITGRYRGTIVNGLYDKKPIISTTNFDQTMWITNHEIPITGRVNPVAYGAEVIRNFYLVGGFIKHISIKNGDQVMFFADNIDARRGYLIPIGFVFARSKNLVIIIEADIYIRCYAEYLWLMYQYKENSVDFVKTKQSITKYDGFQSNTYHKSRL